MKKISRNFFFFVKRKKTKQKHLKKQKQLIILQHSNQWRKIRKQTTTLPKTNARIEKNQNQKMESETEIIQIIVLLKYPNNDVLLLR